MVIFNPSAETTCSGYEPKYGPKNEPRLKWSFGCETLKHHCNITGYKYITHDEKQGACLSVEELLKLQLEETEPTEESKPTDKAAAKLEAIKQVLSKRVDCLCRAIDAREGQTEWYQGKKAGYLDALDLLDESLESIKIEL
jgi:hypothetical protein